MGGFFEPVGHFEGREPSSVSPTVLSMTNETRPLYVKLYYSNVEIGKYSPTSLCCNSYIEYDT